MHDYVVVGAGTAGCVLAARLTESPDVSVLLLEAGPPARRKLEVRVPAAFSRLYRTEVDWGYSTVPQPELDGRELVYPLGRMLGGSASMNAMIVARGNRLDYAEWDAVAPGWAWGDVLPYYEKSSARFPLAEQRDTSPLSDAFVASAQAAGIPLRPDLNDPDNEGVGVARVSQRRGQRFSVVDGYLRPALRRPNLTLHTDALVTGIALDGTRATGVTVRVDGAEEEVSARRGVILAAGAIGSPRLLQLSGIGSRDVLADARVPLVHELPGVGESLRDHVASGLVVRTRPGVETLTSASSARHTARWLLFRRGPLTSNVGEAIAFVCTSPDLLAPDVELVFAPVPFEEEGTKEPTEHGVTIGVVQLQPRSAGSVRITSSDPLAPPAVDPAFLRDPRDEEPLLRGLRLARRIAAADPLASFLAEEMLPGDEVIDDEGLLRHVREQSQTLYHPVASCRMGTDGLAVVDPTLRVRGLHGLRVADASVMPYLPRGHTNWPTVMIAERAADFVAGDPG